VATRRQALEVVMADKRCASDKRFSARTEPGVACADAFGLLREPVFFGVGRRLGLHHHGAAAGHCASAISSKARCAKFSVNRKSSRIRCLNHLTPDRPNGLCLAPDGD